MSAVKQLILQGYLRQDIGDLYDSILELRAGQEQQSRVLDYLLKKEQERQNES